MIMKYKGYNELYKKRKSVSEVKIDEFSNQEYSDIMFWFNMAWVDPVWVNKYSKVKKLVKKNKGYTLEDRLLLLNIQKEMM